MLRLFQRKFAHFREPDSLRDIVKEQREPGLQKAQHAKSHFATANP
jgi:hypothetical protein